MNLRSWSFIVLAALLLVLPEVALSGVDATVSYSVSENFKKIMEWSIPAMKVLAIIAIGLGAAHTFVSGSFSGLAGPIFILIFAFGAEAVFLDGEDNATKKNEAITKEISDEINPNDINNPDHAIVENEAQSDVDLNPSNQVSNPENKVEFPVGLNITILTFGGIVILFMLFKSDYNIFRRNDIEVDDLLDRLNTQIENASYANTSEPEPISLDDMPVHGLEVQEPSKKGRKVTL